VFRAPFSVPVSSTAPKNPSRPSQFSSIVAHTPRDSHMKRLKWFLLGLAIIVAGITAGYLVVRHQPGAARHSEQMASAFDDQSRSGEGASAPPQAVLASGNAAPALAQPSARQLVAGLAQLALGGSPMGNEPAERWKRVFQDLVQQGTVAVPAIREFLEKNQDASFGDTGSKLLGVSSLRTGLLEALRQIGGPEALEVSRQVLSTTVDPVEIAALARNIEEAAPGQHRQEILDAAKRPLELAAAGQAQVQETAPLFQVLQAYGDSTVAADLERLLPNWNQYTAMALGGLSSGQGIPSLIRLAAEANAPGAGNSQAALRMLAQLSAQYPEAGSALVEFARQNQISDAAWTVVAAGLSGDQYQFSKPATDTTSATGNAPQFKHYHISAGNQNFYAVPLPGDGAGADRAQRLAILDQLLAANSNPAATEALKTARTLLSATPPGR
jgi:hypothetical protein